MSKWQPGDIVQVNPKYSWAFYPQQDWVNKPLLVVQGYDGNHIYCIRQDGSGLEAQIHSYTSWGAKVFDYTDYYISYLGNMEDVLVGVI